MTNASRLTQDLTGAAPAQDGLTFDHGAIGRFNAWFFTTIDGLRAGTVLEIGAGTSASRCLGR